jgi:hypothetical protein
MKKTYTITTKGHTGWTRVAKVEARSVDEALVLALVDGSRERVQVVAANGCVVFLATELAN